ncbi:MAG: hypothetical protein AAF618_05055 [Pseudomonadota bacterium]
MEFINAALAFSVIMITMSTAATALTEAFLRLTSQRSSVLAAAVLQFLRTDPRIKKAIKDAVERSSAIRQLDAALAIAEASVDELAQEADTRIDAFLDAFGIDADETLSAQELVERAKDYLTAKPNDLTQAEYRATKVSEKEAALELEAREALVANPAAQMSVSRFSGTKRVDTLTTYAFVQRLAETEIGRALGKDVEAVTMKALTRGFERFKTASNEFFRKRARTATMASAFVLAFTVNIPAGSIFTYVMENPDLAADIASGAEAAVTANQEQIEARNAALATALAETEADALLDPEKADAAIAASEELALALGDLKATITETRGLFNLPLGYDGLWARETCGAEEAASFWATSAACLSASGFWFWVVNVALSGVLIGLGGPFWYRVYAGLSQTAQVLRALGGGARSETLGETDKGETLAESAQTRAAVEDQLLDLFKTNLPRT